MVSHSAPATVQAVSTHLLVEVEQVWSCGQELGFDGLHVSPQTGAPSAIVTGAHEVVLGEGLGVAS